MRVYTQEDCVQQNLPENLMNRVLVLPEMKQGSFSFARRMLGMPCKRFPLKPVKLHGAESRM